MCYAFSRDNGFGKRVSSNISTVNEKRVPVYAVLLMAPLRAAHHPAGAEGQVDAEAVPFAFFAVVSIAVIGLYIAYVIPIFLRWRKGDEFEAGPWNNGKKYKWMNSFATFWVVLITIIFCLPFTPAAVPWNSEFSWEAFNYAPLTVGVVICSAPRSPGSSRARKHFTGQIRETDIEEALGECRRTAARRSGSVAFAGVTVEELEKAVAEGTVDTVLLAIADMEGRLQGKRLTAAHFLDEVLEHGAEGCNYLLAVDVDMETVDGYAMSSWDTRLRRLRDGARPRRRCGRSRGCRARRWCWPTCSGRDGTRGRRLAAADPAQAAGAPGRARAERQRRHRARVHRLPRHLRGRLDARATATSSRPTSTTSTTRCSAPRGSSR